MLKLVDGCLACPQCEDIHTHVDDVFVAGRPREDGSVVPVHVDSAGRVFEGTQVALPEKPQRRHLFTLTGFCEDCGSHFAISFEQHKGSTLVRSLEPEWKPIN